MPWPTGSSLRSRVRDGIGVGNGQTVVEYALIVGVVSVGVAVLLTGFGQALIHAAEASVEALVP